MLILNRRDFLKNATAFGALAAPVRRLAMPDVPVPSARELERAVMPSATSIADAARDLAMVV